MPNLGQGLAAGAAGAAQGASFGGPIGAGVLGGVDFLAGLFGGSDKPKEDPITHQARLNQLAAQNQQLAFSRSVPGSDPSELAALSQDRGALGAAQRQQQQQIFGAFNPAQGTGNLADMLKNISNSQIAQNMSLQESHLFNALNQRRQALMDVANSGSRVQSPTYQPLSDLPGMLGKVAQQVAYQQAKNRGGAGSDSNTPDPTAANAFFGPGGVAGANSQDYAAQYWQPDATTQAVPVAPPPAPPTPDQVATQGAFSGLGTNPSISGAASWLKLGDDPSMTAAIQAQQVRMPDGSMDPMSPGYAAWAQQQRQNSMLGGGGGAGVLPGRGAQPVQAMNAFNLSGLAGFQNQLRQSNQLSGPASQRFLVAPGGFRLPY